MKLHIWAQPFLAVFSAVNRMKVRDVVHCCNLLLDFLVASFLSNADDKVAGIEMVCSKLNKDSPKYIYYRLTLAGDNMW